MRTRTLRSSVRLLWLVPLVAAGCSTINGARPPHVPKLRTITSIGDRPTSIIAGVQGEEATASEDLAEAQLSPDGLISGRVLDGRGRPVPQAEVRVALGGAAAGRVVRTRTDEAGGFTLHGLKPGASYQLVAQRDDDQEPLIGQQTAEAGDRRVRIALHDPAQAAAKPLAGQIRPASETAKPDEEPGPGETAGAGVNEDDLPVPAGGLAPTARRRDRTEDDLPPMLATKARWRRGGSADVDDAADPRPRLASGTREIEAEPDDVERVNPLPPARERPSPRAKLFPPPEEDEGQDPLPPAREPGRAARRSSRPPRFEEEEEPALPRRGDRRPSARAVEEDEDDPLPPARESEEGPSPREPGRGAGPIAPGGTDGFAAPRTTTPAEIAPPPHDIPSPPLADRAPANPAAPEEEVNPLPPAREPAPASSASALASPPRVEEPPIPSEAPASTGEATPAPTPAPAIPSEPPVPSASPIEPPKIPDLPPSGAGSGEPTAVGSEPTGAEPVEAPVVEQGPKEAINPAPVVEPAPEPKAAESPAPAEPKPEDAATTPEESLAPAQEPPVEPGPATIEPAPTRTEVPRSARAKKRPTWGEVDSHLPPVLAMRNPRATARPEPATSSPAPERNGAAPGRQRDGTSARAECRYDAGRRQVVDFRLPDLQGRPVRFKDLDADLVLIDFWGTWCGPCLESIPRLVELQSKFGSDRLKIVGIAYEQAASEGVAAGVRSVSQRLGINYAVLLGEADGRPCPLREALRVEGFPTLVLLDREGRILWRDMGSGGQTLDRLVSVISSNLARGDGAVRR